MIPDNLQRSLIAYCTERRPTGGFLRACLEDRFVDACARADETSAAHMRDIARWIFNYAPSHAWGSPEKVTAWLSGEGGPAFIEPGGDSPEGAGP